MRILDVGAGMRLLSIELGRKSGLSGRVMGVDIT